MKNLFCFLAVLLSTNYLLAKMPTSFKEAAQNSRRGDHYITNVSWFDEVQDCNWIENGQPVGGQEPKTNEEGSYVLGEVADQVISLNEGLTGFLPKQEEREGQINPILMMDPASVDEVGRALKEKVIDKEASSGTNKSGDKFHTAATRIETRADEDIIRIRTVQERVEEAAVVRTGFVDLVKNDAKNRSVFISELQQIWGSDIISTSSEAAIKLAVRARENALETEIEAIAAKDEANAMNFDKEVEAYQVAQAAWHKAAIACNQALKPVATTNVEFNKNIEFKELTTLLQTAKVRESIWAAHIDWVKARKKELAIKDPDHLSEEEAIAIETAWGETVEATQAALDKLFEVDLASLITLEEPEIRALLTEVETQQKLWLDKIEEIKRLNIQGTQKIREDSKQNKEDLLLQKIRRNKEIATRLAKKAVCSEYNQSIYEGWPLPGQIYGLTSSFFEVDQEHTFEDIAPPIGLDIELEKLNRRLLEVEQKDNASLSTIPTESSLVEDEKKDDDRALKQGETTSSQLEEQAFSEIITSSLKPTPENEYRWALRKEADFLYVEAAKIVMNTRAARIAEEEESSEVTDETEKTTLMSGISKSISSLWYPQNMSVIGSTFSKISKPIHSVTQKEKDPYQAADEAEKKWQALVNEAEKIRIKNKGMLLKDSFLMMDAWQEGDREAIRVQNKQERIQKEKDIAKKLQVSWFSNTVRWKAMELADQRVREAIEAEEKAKLLREEKILLYSKAGAKNIDKQKASKLHEEASCEADKARTIATESEKQWKILASNHHSITESLNPEDALEKLKTFDQAVNNLWIEVTNRYDEDLFNEEEDKSAQQIRINQEGELYKEKLLEIRSVDISDCFAHVKEKLEQAQNKYAKAKTEANKIACKPFYDEVDQLEIQARKEYAQKANQEALAAARKKIPGAMEAWIHRESQSEEARTHQEKISARKAPCSNLWADENKRLCDHTEAIASIDKEAFNTFRCEDQRLSDIETLWIAIIEAKNNEAKIKGENAVKAYANGDKVAWFSLSSCERDIYNKEIDRKKDYLNENKIVQAEIRIQAELRIHSIRASERAKESYYKERSSYYEQASTYWTQAALARASSKSEELAALLVTAAERIEKAAGYVPSSDDIERYHRNRGKINDNWLYEPDPRDPNEDLAIAESLKESARCLSQAVEWFSKASEVRDSEQPQLAIHWTKAAEQSKSLADHFSGASQARTNRELRYLWDSTALLSETAEYLSKAFEAGIADKEYIAKLYTQVAEQKKISVEHYCKAAEAEVKNDKADSTRWVEAGKLANSSAYYLALAATTVLEKETEVMLQEDNSKTPDYQEKAKQHLEFAECQRQEAEACTRGNAAEGIRFAKAATSTWNSSQRLKLAATALEKVTMVTAANVPELAALWTKNAQQNKELAEHYRQEALAKASGNITEIDRFDKANRSASTSAKRLDLAVVALEKATVGTVEHHQELAALWSNIAVHNQAAAEYLYKDAEATVKENVVGKNRWNRAGNYSEYSADQLRLAAEALEKVTTVTAQSNLRLVDLWRTIAQQAQKTAEHYRRAAEAWVSGNEAEGTQFFHIGRSSENSATQLYSAAKALEKGVAATIQNNHLLANHCNKTSSLYQESAEHYRKSTEAENRGDYAESTRWVEKGRLAHFNANRFSSATTTLEKATASTDNEHYSLTQATAAMAQNNHFLADHWNQTALQYKQAAEYYQKTAEAEIKEDKEEITRCSKAAETAKERADRCASAATIALQKETKVIAKAHHSPISQSQKNEKAYQKTVENPKEAAEVVLKAELKNLQLEANIQVAQATERAEIAEVASSVAHNKCDYAMTTYWDNVKTQSKRVAYSWREISEALKQGNREKASSLRRLVKQYPAELDLVATSLEKASEIKKTGNHSLTKLWEKTAQQYQQAAEYEIKAINSYYIVVRSSDNEEEFISFFYANESAKTSAYELEAATSVLEQAALATAQGNGPLAELWSKTASQYQELAGYYNQEAEEHAKGSKAKNNLFQTGSSARSSVSQLESASFALGESSKATTQGNTSLAELWRRSAQQYQEAAEHHCQAAIVGASGNTIEANLFDKAGSSAQQGAKQLGEKYSSSAASALDKVSKATAQGNIPLADLCQQTVQRHQEASEYYHQAVIAWRSGNTTAADNFDKAGRFASCSASGLESAATALEKTPTTTVVELVTLWGKSVQQLKEAAEYWRKAADAMASGNAIAADRFDKEAWAANGSAAALEKQAKPLKEATVKYNQMGPLAYVLEKQAEAIKKATQTATKYNQRPLAELCEKTAQQYQELADYHRQTIPATMKGNETENTRFAKASISSKCSADQLDLAMVALQRASLETEEYHLPLAELWSKTVQQHQKLAEHYRHAAIARASGNVTEVDRFDKAEEFARFSANRLGLATDALKEVSSTSRLSVQGKYPIAELWSKTAQQHLEAAEHYCKAVEAAVDNAIEQERWGNLGSLIGDHADQLGLASKAFEKAFHDPNDREELWKKTAQQYQKLAEHYHHAVEVALIGNEAEHTRFAKAAEIAKSSATQLSLAALAIEKRRIAKNQQNWSVEELWSKNVQQHQKAADYYHQAAEAQAKGNEIEVTRFSQAAETAKLSAEQTKPS